MTNPKTEIGAVWQLFFTNEEEERVKALLRCHQLPEDKIGLKSFLLRKITKPETPTLSPEMEAILEKGIHMAGNWIKKKAGI